MIEKGRLGVLSPFYNIMVRLMARSYLWGLVKFHIGGKVRARLLNG